MNLGCIKNMKKIILNKEPSYESKLNSFKYQEEAVDFVKDLDYAAIFHEQGLGKTKIALDIALYWISKRDIDTVLIVTKKGLIKNWEEETKMHSYLHPKVLTNNRNSNYYVFNSPARLIITNFETVSLEKNRLKLFAKARNIGIIIDESAKLKNPKSKLTEDFFELSQFFKYKIIMSGTPVANRPYDIWAQIYFLDNGISLGNNFDDFKKKADLTNKLSSDDEKKIEFENFISEIFGKISKFAIRETKSSAKLSLPGKKYIDCWTIFNPKQKEMYDELKSQLVVEIKKDGKNLIDDASPILKRIMRLVQITSNPKMLNSSINFISSKERELDSLLKEIIGRDEKVIVWTIYKFNVDYFCNKYSNYNAVKIDGSMSIEERNSSINKFKYGDAKVLIATPQSAKEGLTLTVANNAIFYDRSFSLDDYLQAQDRIHRISQTKDCNIYNIMIRGSIDEWINKLLLSKEKAASLVQNDITLSEYESVADYSYDKLIKKILDMEE